MLMARLANRGLPWGGEAECMGLHLDRSRGRILYLLGDSLPIHGWLVPVQIASMLLDLVEGQCDCE